jgi:hypothetical protein
LWNSSCSPVTSSSLSNYCSNFISPRTISE